MAGHGATTPINSTASILGSLLGQTEQNIRQALHIADAMSPCVLFCDELDKALSGVARSGNT